METLEFYTHSIRRKIIECLHEICEASFSELLKNTGIEKDHGTLGYHLRRLVSNNLVEYKTSTKKFVLTERGYIIGELIWDAQFLTARRLDLANEPSRYIRHLRFGEHSILFHDTEDIKRGITYPFLLAGLLKGEAVVYVVSEHKLDSENINVRGYGIRVEDFGKEAFTTLSAEEWYMKKGKAQAGTIIANWQNLIKQKQKDGFKGLYLAGEMNVFFDYANSNELLRYEEMLNSQFPSNMCALCLYDTNKLDYEKFIQLNKSHEHLIFKGIALKTT